MNILYYYTLIVIPALFMTACSQQSFKTSNNRAPVIQSSQQNSQVTQLPQQSPVTNIQPARLRMIEIAKSTIGVPYKWGGNNPQRGFDCSGLMSYVHKNALGLKIPRTAAQQRDNSRTINYAQLKPGDMLFFKTGKRSNHVGVYIGDRKFIHAPSGGKRVKVASMNSSYWHKRFLNLVVIFKLNNLIFQIGEVFCALCFKPI